MDDVALVSSVGAAGSRAAGRHEPALPEDYIARGHASGVPAADVQRRADAVRPFLTAAVSAFSVMAACARWFRDATVRMTGHDRYDDVLSPASRAPWNAGDTGGARRRSRRLRRAIGGASRRQ